MSGNRLSFGDCLCYAIVIVFFIVTLVCFAFLETIIVPEMYLSVQFYIDMIKNYISCVNYHTSKDAGL